MVKIGVCFYAPRKIELDLKIIEIKINLPKKSSRKFKFMVESYLKTYFKEGYKRGHQILTHKEADYVIDLQKDRVEFMIYSKDENNKTVCCIMNIIKKLSKEFGRDIYLYTSKKENKEGTDLKILEKTEEISKKNNVYIMEY